MRRGGKQARSRKRTGRGTRGEAGRDPTQTNKTRPSKSEKRGEPGNENPNRRRDNSERAQARERHEQRTDASKPPSRPQPQTDRPFAHPTPGGGGLIEARKQERTRMRGKGERENHPSRRHGMTKPPTQSARWNPNKDEQAEERKKNVAPSIYTKKRGDIKSYSDTPRGRIAASSKSATGLVGY